MIVTGASVEDVELIVRAVSATKYNGNVEIREISDKSGPRTVRTSFTLRVKDGHAGSPGAKGTRAYNSSRNGSGPHGLHRSDMGACWHVHYDVLETLFTHHPQAKVTSVMASYTAENFHRNAIQTASWNAGSQIQPVYSVELCECEHHTDDETQQVINGGGTRLADGRITPAGQGVATAILWDACRIVDEDQTGYASYYRTQDSDLGKYASGGAYGADLTTAIIRGEYCGDCGCPS